jgi:3-(3-hydroxy-phenyl)propionate hydroxylase
MPDLEIITTKGPTRVFTLMHEARPLLINFGGQLDADTQVHVVKATYDGPWELPVIGPVSAPTAVLVRPDGYVAWVGDLSDDSLSAALTKWFG